MPRRRRWTWLALAAAAILLPTAYFALGAWAISRIDDNIADVAPAPTDKPFQIARTLEKILAHELETSSWRPSDPWFYPTTFADNKKNFQLGVLQGTRRSLLEYASRTIKARRDGSVDPDLQGALNQLQYPPNVWLFDVNQGFGPSTQSQYLSALESLRKFEAKAMGEGEYAELRADQLLRLVDAVNVDLMAHVISLQDFAQTRAFVIDTRADDLFYQTKGAAFVYAALAQAIKHDFADIVAQKHLSDLWAQLETNLNRLVKLSPLTVVTAKDDSIFLPNHLLVQGFYASRAAEILTHVEAALRT